MRSSVVFALSLFVLLVSGVFAQSAGEPAIGTEQPVSATDAAGVRSVFDYIQKGGPMMIPIAICSLLMLAVSAERLMSLRRKRIIPPNFLDGLQKVMEETGNDRERALEYCSKRASPISNICIAGIRKLGRPVEAIERSVQDAGEWEVFKLRKYVRALSVIAAIAPLMGLVGTIFGMIRAFQTVAVSGEALGKTELLAEGIYEAMVTTAAGLLVAIPAVIFYHWISSKIDRLVAEMDRACITFIEESLVPEPVVTPRLARELGEGESKPDRAPAAAVAS